jgi:hypothetical protein
MDDNDDLQRVMELIQMGRTASLPCPFCHNDTLKGAPSDYGVRYTCPSCRKYVEAPEAF